MAVARDAEGRPTSVTLAPGKSITYAYNPRGLVASVTDWTGGGATYGYDDAGRMVSITRSNGVTTRYRHDTDDRLVGIDEDAAARLSSIVLARNARGDITASSRTGLLDPAPAIQSVVAAYDAAHQRQGWCKVFCV
ncbi:MAG: RHS repeat protein [Deltaproteobacteria bacterium]|nr:RHS repeat protein [Deltaproteobacteria bacterium]